MVAGSILPVSFHNGKLYFLFGKENPLEDSSKGFSDFGGGVESGETPFKTAVREGVEELTGFLGDTNQIKTLIKRGKGPIILTHNNYHVHMFFMEYDEKLPIYYNNNHSFLWKKMDINYLNKTKLFEKIEIQWFSEDDLIQHRQHFREFYKEILDKIIEYIPTLHKKANMRTSTNNMKSIKNKNGNYKNKKTKKLKGG
jgi:hypothetical protein